MFSSKNSHSSDHTPLSFENLLIHRKILSSDQISALRHEQGVTSSSQIILIAKSKIIEAIALKNLLIDTYHVDEFSIDLINKAHLNNLFDKAVPQLFKNNLCVPFFIDQAQSILYIASVDILNIKIHHAVQQIYQVEQVKIFAATSAEIHEILEFYVSEVVPFEHFLVNAAMTDDSYFQNLSDLMIQDAALYNASDIHLDVNCLFLVIRYRIDGVLIERFNLHNEFWPRLLNCFKVKSHLNITEIRLPQSGRFTVNFKSHIIDCRFSTHPTPYGECAVIRMLNHDRGLIPLDQLGFDDHQVTNLVDQCNKPNGLIIFCGPTGSGKTTSLYAVIKAVANTQKNYITLEDPIEYNITHLRQSQVNIAVGFDYEVGIKSILRQDPDVILIGEIRDEATAMMAIRAAMTGHLVLTTLHVNNVFQVGQRLQDLGIKLRQLSGLIRTIVSQRLVRCICWQCRGQNNEAIACQECRGIGYKGRTVIAEILNFNDEIDQYFTAGNLNQLKYCARSRGFKSFDEHAEEKKHRNLITDDEIKRVLG